MSLLTIPPALCATSLCTREALEFRACGRGERIATTSLHPKGTCFAARTGWERQHRDGSRGQAEGDGKGAKGARRNVGKVGAFFALSALFPKK